MTSPSSGSEPARQRPIAVMLLPVMLAMALAVSDQTMISTALPSIVGELGGLGVISWVVVAYLMTNTLAAPVYGRLGDLLGRRRMLVFALGLFMTGSILCALAWRIEALIAARAFQGIGGGGLMTLSHALVGQVVAPRERGRYQGYLATVQICATTIGPLCSGLITQFVGWRYIFSVGLLVGLAALALSSLLPKGKPSEAKEAFDVPGLIYFVSTVAPILLAIHQVQGLDASALPLIALLFGIAGVAIVLLVRREMRAPAPLFSVNLMRQASIWRSDLVAACHGATIVSLVTFVPIYLRVAKGLNDTEIGVLLLTLTAGSGVGSMLTGHLVTRTGRTVLFPSIGLSIAMVVVFSLGWFTPYLEIWQLPWIFGVISICVGTVMGVLQVTVQQVAGPLHIGAAAGSVQFSRSLGAASGTSIIGAVLFSMLASGDPDAARLFSDMLAHGPSVLDALQQGQRERIGWEVADAFRAAFMTVAGFLAIGAALAWSIPDRRI